MLEEGKKGLVIGVMVLTSACVASQSRETAPGEETTQTAGVETNSSDLSGFSLSEMTEVDFQNGRGSLSIKGKSKTHLLVVSVTNTTPSTYNLQLADQDQSSLLLSTLQRSLEKEEVSEPEQFHEWMREMEVVMAESDDFIPPSRLSRLASPRSLGQKDTFKVLSSMTSLSEYEEVEATLRATTENLYVYVDNAAADHIDDKNLQELADDFQQVVIPREREFFGNESDVNGDGHITILMSCWPNQMATSGGLVTGFFFPGDLYPASSGNPASNSQEIFYTLCPDPNGEYGVPVSVDFAIGNILPGVLAHEYQHMISYNQHVLLGKSGTEHPWLNEALSHLTEDLTGFGHENPSRVKLFLNNVASTSLIPATSPRLAERGAGYLFLRYLYEQSSDGSAFLQRLLQGTDTGVDNVVDAFAGEETEFDEFGEFLNQWSLAIALSETGITDDPRYNFQARGTDSQTGNLTGICLRCEANDGRGTILNGPSVTEVNQFPVVTNLASSASQYFLFDDAPGSLAINSAGSPTLTGTLVSLER